MHRLVRRMMPRSIRERPVVPVVRLAGPIGLASPLRAGVTLASVAGPLERAFRMSDTPAVAIVVNSPGGSPVQSMMIYRRIRALAEESGKTVTVFVEDVAASGGYLIALAGDEIIADGASIVGSIGVVTATFGFDRLIERLGIDRRVYTAGDRKMQLDPFQPERAEEVKRLKAIQRDVHADFIALVKQRRNALNGPERTLFSGEFWSGRRALDLGLIDRLGDLRAVMRERFGEKVKLKLVAPPRGLLGRRPSLGFGADMRVPSAGLLADDLIAAIEIRALWARYGL